MPDLYSFSSFFCKFRTFKASGSGESARCHRRPEFAVANRNIPVPDIESMAHRVLHYFADPHAVVEFTEEAQELFVAYAACFSAEQSVSQSC